MIFKKLRRSDLKNEKSGSDSKNKPFYKKLWFWSIIAILLYALISLGAVIPYGEEYIGCRILENFGTAGYNVSNEQEAISALNNLFEEDDGLPSRVITEVKYVTESRTDISGWIEPEGLMVDREGRIHLWRCGY